MTDQSLYQTLQPVVRMGNGVEMTRLSISGLLQKQTIAACRRAQITVS